MIEHMSYKWADDVAERQWSEGEHRSYNMAAVISPEIAGTNHEATYIRYAVRAAKHELIEKLGSLPQDYLWQLSFSERWITDYWIGFNQPVRQLRLTADITLISKAADNPHAASYVNRVNALEEQLRAAKLKILEERYNRRPAVKLARFFKLVKSLFKGKINERK